MRRFNGLETFTIQLTNSGALDLRYANTEGNNGVVTLNSGLAVSGGNIIFDDNGSFNNGIKVSGKMILNDIPISTFNGILFRNGAGYKP